MHLQINTPCVCPNDLSVMVMQLLMFGCREGREKMMRRELGQGYWMRLSLLGICDGVVFSIVQREWESWVRDLRERNSMVAGELHTFIRD